MKQIKLEKTLSINSDDAQTGGKCKYYTNLSAYPPLGTFFLTPILTERGLSQLSENIETYETI